MLTTALELDGPALLRYPKGAARQVPDDEVGSGLGARRVVGGTGDNADVCILAVGKLVEAAEQAAAALADEGVGVTVWDVRVVKPLDPAMLADAAGHRLVVTVEDGIRVGGAGSFMADALASRSPGRPTPPAVILGVPAQFIPQAKPSRILARLGLDGPGIAASVRAALAAQSPVG
jgi:1-deoxy-D-xylulose-5-phosphate synthase